MKPIFFLIAIALFFSAAFAANTIESLPTQVPKGETIQLSGTCTEQTVYIQVTQEKKEIDQLTVLCENNRFHTEYPITYLHPSGTTEFSISNPGSNPQQTEIRNTRESGFLSLSILSPIETQIERQTTLDVQVQVTDAQTPIENATVQTWDFNHRRVNLSHVGKGIYKTKIQVPHDAALEKTQLVITAENPEKTAGGEKKQTLEIQPAKIIIQINQTNLANIPAATPFEFQVESTYSDSTSLSKPIVTISINEQTHQMTQKDETKFTYKTAFTKQEIGNHVIIVTAKDDANNVFEIRQDAFITASVSAQLEQYAPYGLGLVIVVILAWVIVIPRIRSKKTKTSMIERKNQIEQDLTQLQKQYFEQNSVSKDVYRQKTSNLEKELADLNKQLKS